MVWLADGQGFWQQLTAFPRRGEGNDVLCGIPDRAIAIIELMPRAHVK
jgi:hypothetical protein